MCKFAGLLIGWDSAGKRAVIAHGNCDQWTCPECKERMLARWRFRARLGAYHMLAQGESRAFCTITSHEKLKNFSQTCYVFRDAWPTLYKALKRRSDNLMYLMIPEQHEDGRMHVHVIWNSDVSERWLKDNARARGFGYQCDVSEMSQSYQATKYVTKYLTKDIGEEAPRAFRRVRISQNWPDVPKPNSELSGLNWEYTNSRAVLREWLDECQKKRIELIDVRTGVNFEEEGCEWSGAEIIDNC